MSVSVSSNVRSVVVPAVIVIVTLAVFAPVLGNGFVEWGDRGELVENPDFRGFGLSNLYWMFTTTHQGHYQPLTWLTFAADHALWGMRPAGYHLTTLLLHAACAVVVYLIILRLVGPTVILAAFCGALLFALHPLRVEAVAWATERRGPLSSLMALLAVLAYLRGARWWSLAFFALGLLAKEFVMTLPVVLVILDVYPLRRRAWREKIPFFVLTLIAAVVALESSDQSGLALSLADYGMLERIGQCFYGLVFYLQKTLVPLGLSPLYSIPPDVDPFAVRYIVSALFVIALTAGLVAARKRFPAGLAAWAIFIVILSPVLGLVQTGNQLAADRYTYLPGAVIGVLIAAGLTRLDRGPLVVAVVGWIALASALNWPQLAVWRNDETLWTHAVEVNPRCHISNHNLGTEMARQERWEEAAAAYRRALETDPDMDDAKRALELLNSY
jgi:hypothetical protein